jgi:hypothetical protein
VEEVEMRTMDVLTVKEALVPPAGTITPESTPATPLLLESATNAPPAGAPRVKVTVPVEDCKPPTTLDGFRVNEATVGRRTGVTVSEADRVTPPYVPEMVTVVETITALVLTVNVAVVAPAATVTLDGVRATFGLLLESATVAPPDGAAPLSVTVPVEDCMPPTTLVGFSESDERVGGRGAAGIIVSEAVLVEPL